MTVTYASSAPAVATVSGSIVTIVAAGTATLTASQAGDANYLAAASVDAQTPLAPGASYGLSRTVWLPAGVIGSRYIIVATDTYNQQGETNETNNTAALALTISNPDLVERLRNDSSLAVLNPDTLYGGDAAGYTDYPTLAAKTA